MALIRRNPAREVTSLHEKIDRLFDETFNPPAWLSFREENAESIALDLYEEGDKVIIQASVPGIRPQDLHVQLRDDMMSIRAEVQEESEHRDRIYHLQEHRHGGLERTVALPCQVIPEKAEAVYQDGLLTLTLPKAHEVSAREIEIKVAG